MDRSQKKIAKQPVVRQTKSSIYRMAKTNPLLIRENQIKVDDKDIFLPPAVVYSRRLTIDDIDMLKMLRKNGQKSSSHLNELGKQSLDVGRLNKAVITEASSLNTDKLQSNAQSLPTVTSFHHAKKHVSKKVPAPNALISSTKTVLGAKQSSNPKVSRGINNIQEKISKTKGISSKHSKKPLQNVNHKPLNKPKQAINTVGSLLNVKSAPSEPNIKVNLSDGAFKKPPPKVPSKPNIKVNDLNDSAFKRPIIKVPRTSKAETLRRSLSSEHFAKSDKKITDAAFGSSTETLKKLVLFQSLNKIPSDSTIDMTFSNFNKHRRSIISSTPMAKHLPNTAYNRLQQPLKDWLKSRGKSLSNYHHLKCFGLQQMSEEERDEDKENIEGDVKSSSFENLRIPESSTSEETLTENIVTGAIEDLHNLIVSGYPIEQCEPWLDFIRAKYKKIEEQSHYWECRAAIEQGRGNIASAVECYKNSIVNGANFNETLANMINAMEIANVGWLRFFQRQCFVDSNVCMTVKNRVYVDGVDQIDESLSHLLEKFSLLNIEPEPTRSVNKKRKEKEAEVRNIFKSTIIQFAIKERSMNKSKKTESIEGIESKKFIATPVRRSTRASCGKFQLTPGKKLCNTLNELDNSIKESLEFENNSYL